MSDQSRFQFDDSGAYTWAKFLEHHGENPGIYQAMRKFALEALAAGRTRMGINMLHERVRWYTTVDTKGDSFKLNNNWRPHYARLLMEKEPELKDFFETRTAGADDK